MGAGPPTRCADPWETTSSYTGAMVLHSDRHAAAVLVTYDRLADGWLGPPGRNGRDDRVFAMRVSVRRASAKPDDDATALKSDDDDNAAATGWCKRGGGRHPYSTSVAVRKHTQTRTPCD